MARGIWSELAKSSALASGELQTECTCAVMLRQRLSMTLQRESITSRLRLEAISDSVRDPDAALTRYVDFRRGHQDTKTQCQSQGITFIPMVMEAVGGGWGKVARGVWSELAKTSALATGELQTDTSCAILLRQRLSMTLHRENARACLRRF